MQHEIKQFRKVASVIEELSYGNDPYPQIVEIHPTDICNFECVYCFHNGSDYKPIREGEIIDFGHYKSLFQQMYSLDIADLSISGGGEPTMDDRLPDLLAEACKNSLNVRVVTNGSFVDSNLLLELATIGEVRVSVDAIRAETYSKVHKVSKDMFYKVMDNIKKLIAFKEKNGSNLKIGITFLINRVNYLETVDFCEEILRLDIDEIIIKHDVYYTHQIPKERIEKVLDELEIMNDNRINIRRPVIMDLRELGCFVPYFKVALDPYGNVYSCCLAAQPGETNGCMLGNIKNDSFISIWEQSKNLRFALRTKGVPCVYCNYIDYRLNWLIAKHGGGEI